MAKIPLSSLDPGSTGVVETVETSETIRWRLWEMGIAPGESITLIRKTPFGGPMEFEVMNYRLAIRKSEADRIFLKS